jgi:thiamine biosynthesis lipoprotein
VQVSEGLVAMKTGRQWLAAIGVLMLVLLATFYVAGYPGAHKVTKTRFLMDTVVDLTIYGTSKQEAETLCEEVFAEMQRLENIFDKNNPCSDISRINDSAGKKWVKVEPETIYVLQQALEIAQETGGAFDPTVGPLLELWGFGTEQTRVPSMEEISGVLPLVDYTAVQLDATQHKVFLPQRGMKLDLGGIAKGFIIDQGQEMLEQASLRASFINAGGDIGIRGSKPSGEKWVIAIQDPKNPRQWKATLKIAEGGVATSGDYQRDFEEKGQKYHHLLDPKQGVPARGLSSVTVVASESLEADAMATAVFILGKENGLELIEGLPGIEGVLVDEQGKVFITSGLLGDCEVLERDNS